MTAKISKSEACRLIAEKLEASPEWKDQPVSPKLSDGGFWIGRFTSNGVLEFQTAINFFESEDASARLLEAMPEPFLSVFNMPNVGVNHVRVYKCCPQMGSMVMVSGDRKTAIVMAALKWLKIEGEIE